MTVFGCLMELFSKIVLFHISSQMQVLYDFLLNLFVPGVPGTSRRVDEAVLNAGVFPATGRGQGSTGASSAPPPRTSK